jgi:hypothetical protein
MLSADKNMLSADYQLIKWSALSRVYTVMSIARFIFLLKDLRLWLKYICQQDNSFLQNLKTVPMILKYNFYWETATVQFRKGKKEGYLTNLYRNNA